MQEQLPRDVFKEPTGMYLWRVSEGRYTCRGARMAGNLKTPPGIRRMLGLPPEVRFKPMAQASLSIASRSHLLHGSLGRRRPVGSRPQEEDPTPDELCETERRGFDR